MCACVGGGVKVGKPYTNSVVCVFFFIFFWGVGRGGGCFLLFFYAFHFITKQLCRKYALLSNINSILFVYGFPTLTTELQNSYRIVLLNQSRSP
jgi:hypothetical protein